MRDLPYPYTSAAQYARSLETPLGVEWNTRAGFQRATVPRITKKVRWWSFVGLRRLADLFIFLRRRIDGNGHQPAREALLNFMSLHLYLAYLPLTSQYASRRLCPSSRKDAEVLLIH